MHFEYKNTNSIIFRLVEVLKKMGYVMTTSETYNLNNVFLDLQQSQRYVRLLRTELFNI